MSEEVRTNKRRRSESEEPEEEAGDGAGADVVGAGVPVPEVLDGVRTQDNHQGEEADDGADQAAADVAAAAAAEAPKMPSMPPMTMPVQMTHHQPRAEEKQPVETYYKAEQPAVDTGDYKVPGVNVMASMGTAGGVGGGVSSVGAVGTLGTIGGVAGVGNIGAMGGGIGIGGMNPGGMAVNASSLSGLGGMGGLTTLGMPGMNLAGVGGVDLNQQLLQRQYEMSLKAQMNNNAAAAAAAAARAAPKPQAVSTGRKSAPSSYEPPVQLTASGRPARARRVNYAELAGAMDDDEEDDQANLVPNWARRRRKNADQDRDYGVGVGGGSRGGGGGVAQMGGGGGNAAMYGMAGAGNFNAAPRAAAPAAGVNLYGLTGQAAAGLRNAVGGASGAGLQAANLAAGIAGNAALAGQAGWQNQVVWGQAPGMAGPYGALQSLAAAQARPQVAAAQQFLLQPGAGRGVTPNLMQDMQLMLSRGADGQGGMPGAGQQR